MKKNTRLLRMVLSAFFLALAFVLPYVTGHIPQIGAMLCPMHIPVLLCGFICGWEWGLTVGAIAPLLRSLTLGMPPLFPTAICMTFELAAYGALAGLMYNILSKKMSKVVSTYCSLIISMVGGRLIWGVARYICAGFSNTDFGLNAFLAGAVTGSIPGIIVQIVLIPVIVIVLDKTNVTAVLRDRK